MKNKFDKSFVCFSGDTGVLLSDFSNKRIECIETGDIVKSYDLNNNSFEDVIVEKIASSHHKIASKITFSDNNIIKCTVDHPLWIIDKGWCSVSPQITLDNYNLTVGKLDVGDECLSVVYGNLIQMPILKIATISGEFKMHDISGGNYNCFFANGILSHDENLIELDIEGQLQEPRIAL